MLSQYNLFHNCNRTVLSSVCNYNIIQSRNGGQLSKAGVNAAKQALKNRVSTTKTRTLQKADIVRQESSHAWKPEAFRDYSKMATYDLTKYAIGVGVLGTVYIVKKQYEKDNKKNEIAANIVSREDTAAIKIQHDAKKYMDENNCNSVILSKDCSKRSSIERLFDNCSGRKCYDLPKDSPHLDKPDSGRNKHNPSPFENFELILFFPSCGFWFIFLFTSFNLVLFQIILMLFNLHEFLISTFKPNSFILRSNAVLMNFLFNLHCSQSYSWFLLKYFPITLTVFVFILFGNLTGLLPWSFSYTGHIGLTFSLGIMLFQGWLVVGLDRLGGDFWALFIPHNCPKWLFPLMLVIEILSFVIRPFSLAIRLFANILSGHILLHLIKETEEIIRDSENNGYMNMIPSSGSSLVSLSESMVIILELGVACLQGYIFVILSSIYLQESVNERNLGLKSIKEYRTLGYKFINKYILKID
jgi:F-type H+-transporting ATPase subunit a